MYKPPHTIIHVYRCTFHHRMIVESQHGLNWKRPLRSWSPSPCCGLVATHKLRLSRAHPTCPWAPPGMGICSFSGLLVPGLHHTLSEEFLTNI